MKRIFFVAGEASGDSHGAHLVQALREAEPGVVCEGLGGKRMAAAGMELHHDLAGKGIMGFIEVLRHYPMLRRVFLDTEARLRNNPPDALVLIDYPGFNIRLAAAVADVGVPIVYYISPQVWAWKRKRVHTLARVTDKMLVIFPFEAPFYEAAGLPCTHVGHPLIDSVARYRDEHPPGENAGDLLVGLLPGSREQEIRRLLKPMLETARGIREKYPEARFVTPCVDAARAAQVRAIAGDFPLEIREEHGDGNAMYAVLSPARFALVASGTATLETALFGVPMLITYKMNPVTYALARLLVRVDHIGIVNIIAGKRLCPEFLQGAVAAERMLPAALALLEDSPARSEMLAGLEEVRNALGGGGASAAAAREVLAAIKT